MSADFVAHMEDVLDLYAEPYNPERPVVCFDETSTQLLSDAWPPIPAASGQPRREDYEYRREGTRNLFLACEPLGGWRHVEVTERRTKEDFAHQMRWLVDEAYPEVQMVRVVLDNLNTHRRAPLYEAFPAREARRIAKRLEFSLHSQARQLAEYGGDRVQLLLPQLPQATPPQRGIPLPGGPRPGTGTKRSSSPHQLALQHPARQNQTPSPVSHQFLT